MQGGSNDDDTSGGMLTSPGQPAGSHPTGQVSSHQTTRWVGIKLCPFGGDNEH